ncbi:DUF3578 domain-containing protein [Kaistella sp. PBT33-4]|uniref:McrB family protein n=1 Tax=Kaistella sp. PBT33-4 TaxID=3032000 RepID=UPI0023D7D847|nr:DUF3578 domain-containing protein [Kaistella sp. PBT33-4]MDF0720752.1 DUF3578 domain-containing protein [Kaistella sp. PBT33-4]
MEFSRNDLLEAINIIDENPALRNKRSSSTYDLFFEGKTYPPILVLSIANQLKNGKEIFLDDFDKKVDVPFRILKDHGFEIIRKIQSYYNELIKFLQQARTADQKTSQYQKSFLDLSANVSFGKGAPAKIPWISFLRKEVTTSNGIYPVYLYYKKEGILILAYGISETNDSKFHWPIKQHQTIEEYFGQNNLGKPFRYGRSYIYKVYDANNMPDQRTIDEDLISLLEFYKSLELDDTSLRDPKPNNFDLLILKKDLINVNLKFSETLTQRFVASLLTKPFVILTGLSGSGKTKLAQAFVQWICQDESQYRIIPVGADWTNREPLLGYPNALKPEEYVKPDSGVLDLIIQANNQPDLPHFLILDEMNLSHVERYFADFLSVMESKEEIPLYAEGTVQNGIPARLKLPSNLFIIGTVNIDETTNMFSPKVLDRANTIEFRVTQDEMKNFLGNIKDINMGTLTGNGAGMAKSFLELAASKEFATAGITEINEALLQFFGELKKTGAEFGYRTAIEILRLIHQLTVLDYTLTAHQKIDIAIMQKLLPKLHGSRRKLCPVLETLGSFCITGDIKIIKDVFENVDFDFNGTNVLYSLSLEKISRMYRGAIDNGFASFAEA